jgi:probable phosphoglycerate mutase
VKRVSFVRHGESESNAGLPTDGPMLTALTEKGHKQAEQFALAWPDAPQLVVTSKFIRTQQTASPFMFRFARTLHERWDVHELTQLGAHRYKGTTHAERHPAVKEYWDRNDEDFVDGEGAESFAAFRARVLSCLQRARSHFAQDIVVFTHGALMQAVLYYVLRGNLPMKEYFQFSAGFPIDNCDLMTLVLDEQQGHWSVGMINRSRL